MTEQNIGSIDRKYVPTKHLNRTPLLAHLSMFSACAIWGPMAPIDKDAMLHGANGVSTVPFRVLGGVILLWMSSLFIKHEHVSLWDVLWFIGAAISGLVCNQYCFTIELSYTSPINASIVTTSMLIFAMVLETFILREPITGKKTMDVLIGCCSTLILILTSIAASNAKAGDIRGDLMVMGARLSRTFYLSIFNKLVERYSISTINKWMFLRITCLIWPFSFRGVMDISWAAIPAKAWLKTTYVVFSGTFVGYTLVVSAQRVLRLTVVSSYNYVQPVVAVVVTVLTGMGIFKQTHGLAVLVVFVGIWMVTKSRSRHDMVDNKGELIYDSAQQSARNTSKVCEERQLSPINKPSKKDVFFL